MKKILFLFAFILTLSIMACYVEDPAKYLNISTITITVGNGDIVYYFPNINSNYLGTGTWNGKEFNLDYKSAFPITVNLQFVGFENDNSKVIRACLLYLNKQGRWQIIKNIQNPVYEIESSDGFGKAIFGTQVIQNSAGYKNGEIMFIISYFETENNKTHNLNQLLNAKQTTSTLTTERLKDLGAIAIGVVSNRKPF